MTGELAPLPGVIEVRPVKVRQRCGPNLLHAAPPLVFDGACALAIRRFARIAPRCRLSFLIVDASTACPSTAFGDTSSQPRQRDRYPAMLHGLLLLAGGWEAVDIGHGCRTRRTGRP